LHATEALHFFHVTRNTSTSKGIFSEVIAFDFSAEGHTISSQQAGCFYFVPGGFVQGQKNCLRIGILYLIGSAARSSPDLFSVILAPRFSEFCGLFGNVQSIVALFEPLHRLQSQGTSRY
jgi:hypothetical protein